MPSLRDILLWSATIRDDRGEKRMLDARDWKRAPAWSDPRKQFALEEARRLAGIGARKLPPQLQALWAGVAVLGFVGFVVMLTTLASAIPTWAIYVIACAYFYGAVRFIVPRMAIINRDRIVDLVTGADLCAACAYDLSRTEPTLDARFVVCPECGAAWRAARIRERRPVQGRNSEPDARRALSWATQSHLSRRTVIEDDAGHQTVLQARHPKEALRVIGEGADRPRWMHAHAGVRRLGAGRRIVLGGAVIVSGVMEASLRLAQMPPVTSGGALASVGLRMLWPVFMVLMGVRIMLGNWGLDRRRAKEILLASALCPTCSDDLRQCPVGDDGLTRCRTCGAAWRLGERQAGAGPLWVDGAPLCPECSYNMRGIPVDKATGLANCPECGIEVRVPGAKPT